MEDLISKELLETNREYLTLKKQYRTSISRKKALNNLIKYIKNGNYKYAIGRIANEISKCKVNNFSDIDDKRKVNLCGSQYVNNSDKVVVYTVVTGGYDNIKEPLYINKNIDYICITDCDIKQKTRWKIIRIDKLGMNLEDINEQELSRLPKIKPHMFFDKYKYSLYIDGNIRIMADVLPLIEDLGRNVIGIHKHSGRNCVYDEAEAILALKKSSFAEVHKQIERYRREGYPRHNGLFQCNIIVREHNNPSCISIMNKWWQEYYYTGSKRDQLSLPYSIWQCGYNTRSINSLGENWEENPRFRGYGHI